MFPLWLFPWLFLIVMLCSSPPPLFGLVLCSFSMWSDKRFMGHGRTRFMGEAREKKTRPHCQPVMFVRPVAIGRARWTATTQETKHKNHSAPSSSSLHMLFPYWTSGFVFLSRGVSSGVHFSGRSGAKTCREKRGIANHSRQNEN